MQIVYNGVHPEVVVDALDSGQVIARGESVEIPNDLAASLLMQDTWSQAAFKAAVAPTPDPTPSPIVVTVEPAPDTTTKADS